MKNFWANRKFSGRNLVTVLTVVSAAVVLILPSLVPMDELMATPYGAVMVVSLGWLVGTGAMIIVWAVVEVIFPKVRPDDSEEEEEQHGPDYPADSTY